MNEDKKFEAVELKEDDLKNVSGGERRESSTMKYCSNCGMMRRYIEASGGRCFCIECHSVM